MVNDDMELVQQYAASQSESAFEALVSRYTNLVYSAAFRRTGNSQLAEEITQAVFVILAQKAATLHKKTILPGWLYRAAYYVSGHAIKQELRRQRRELEAYMQSLSDETGAEVWSQITPLLEEAMMRLGQSERDALVLRFFEGHSLKEVGVALGASESATKMRVSRALEKLRVHLSRSGVHSTAETIAGAISANAIMIAPAALAKTATAVALAKGATASFSTSTLIKGALKVMAWSKAKTVIAAGIAVLVAGSATTLVATKTIQELRQPAVDESFWLPQNFQKAPPVLIIRPTKSEGRGGFGEAMPSGKALELNTDLKGLLSVAYDIPPARIVIPDNLPTNRFDLLLTLTDQPRQKLQAELLKRFGVNGRLATLNTDGLALKIDNVNAPGLTLASGKMRGSFMMSSMSVVKSGTPPEPGANNGGKDSGTFGGPMPP
jgi:RNA polymerase sigma factor (sigma-70 family)